jgi:hypothetical protein
VQAPAGEDRPKLAPAARELFGKRLQVTAGNTCKIQKLYKADDFLTGPSLTAAGRSRRNESRHANAEGVFRMKLGLLAVLAAGAVTLVVP